MSRIHEALKKAAQERSSRLATGVAPDLAGLAADIQRPVVPPAVVSEAAVADLRAAADLPFLRFEELTRRCAHPTWHFDPRMSVFHGATVERTAAEHFRTLRSRLYQIAGIQPLRRVLVTSSVAGEGKTFVAANLAQSIVRQPERRVLLIDADLRVPALHQALGAPNTPGLTEFLRGEADEYAVIQKGTEGNLCFIPGGTLVSNPSELLLSDRMTQLLDLVTPVFDWIILDSPPTLPVHDASMLADRCDGVLFVVGAGSTDHEIAEKAIAEFREKNLLGAVLNGTSDRDSYGGYYGYRGKEKK